MNEKPRLLIPSAVIAAAMVLVFGSIRGYQPEKDRSPAQQTVTSSQPVPMTSPIERVCGGVPSARNCGCNGNKTDDYCTLKTSHRCYCQGNSSPSPTPQ
jgi:hypothetical protein